MPELDLVASLIDELRGQRTESEPLYVTASRVFYEGIDDLGDEEMSALEEVGFLAIKNEGEPEVIKVPSVVWMIDQGRPYDHVEIDPEDRPKVMFLGFLALAAEQFMQEEVDDA